MYYFYSIHTKSSHAFYFFFIESLINLNIFDMKLNAQCQNFRINEEPKSDFQNIELNRREKDEENAKNKDRFPCPFSVESLIHKSGNIIYF